MTELRARMIPDMTLRRFSPRTHGAYLSHLVALVRHYHRAPDQISAEEVRQYLAHLLQEKKLSWSTSNQAACAFRFFYHTTLGRPAAEFVVPMARTPQRLPEILSRAEVLRILHAPRSPKHRLLLATVYACGLRVSEAVRLLVKDIDSERMTLRVEQGKGGKDRYLPLSERLLEEMRQYWREHPPGEWLWAGDPGRTPAPMHISTAQKVYGFAKQLAGVRKKGGIHALRHAFATHLLEAGVDVHTVQRLLGHRFITSTIRYFHLSRTRLAATRSPYDLPDPSQS